MSRISLLRIFVTFFIGLCLILKSGSVLAIPSIGIGSMYDIIAPEKQAINKRIYNTGASTAFVRIELLEVDIKNKEKILETPVKEVAGNILEKDRLIVTPLRMIIPPSSFQLIRFMWPGERVAEKYYRVRFTPVLPETGDSFGLNEQQILQYREKALSVGLNIMAGYGTLVIVQPSKPVFNTLIETQPSDFISVVNNGNSTIALENIRNCNSADTDCSSAARQFVLPGQTKRIAKMKGLKTSFTLIEGKEQKKLRY
ncbi:hypothetical protein [Vagococcus sp. WN89Y]|uniref:hypothetical protein n=1 Tax=Vagococcus sp. WN89Y TaxID=3457258 RepID=UPI003FCEB009